MSAVMGEASVVVVAVGGVTAGGMADGSGDGGGGRGDERRRGR